ncbi:hypothetical protein [Sphingobacterium thalpophilum]|uniref:hypothetical protein n=1 Tax=Sphingobacterium thalpophilum TaxID=259 RepID=UPI003D98EB87
MTLGFMQNWPKSMAMENEATYFIAKIWMGIPQQYKSLKIHDDYCTKHVHQFNAHWDVPDLEIKPKLHTIRHDEGERWKPGIDIHFVINSRTKSRFQFAPVIPVVSVQTIEIKHAFPHRYVFVDGRYLSSWKEMNQLALNDGFESMDDFFKYFNEDFKGRLIHWTNLSY